MTALGWERGGLALTVYFASLAAGRFRAGQKQRAAQRTPLFDAAVLEAALHPRLQDGDDAALLTELREKLVALNRQADAEKFFALHTQIAALPQSLGSVQTATLRRTVLRLLASQDHPLQCVGAQVAADLQMAEAAPLIQMLLLEEAWDSRSRKVLEESLAVLTSVAPHA